MSNLELEEKSVQIVKNIDVLDSVNMAVDLKSHFFILEEVNVCAHIAS